MIFHDVFERCENFRFLTDPLLVESLIKLLQQNGESQHVLLLAPQILELISFGGIGKEKMTQVVECVARFDLKNAIDFCRHYRLGKSLVRLVFYGGAAHYGDLHSSLCVEPIMPV